MDRIIARIQAAMSELDLGISAMSMRGDFIGSVNRALREVGSPQIFDIEDEAGLVRAMLALEAEV
jgi:hypothetical protein